MKRRLTRWALPCAALALGACTQFPELEHTMTDEVQQADYPTLIPIEPLIAQSQVAGIDAAQTEAGLQSRLARLRARANGLRGSVLSGREKQRLEDGLR